MEMRQGELFLGVILALLVSRRNDDMPHSLADCGSLPRNCSPVTRWPCCSKLKPLTAPAAAGCLAHSCYCW